jgi:hypothetical protein
MARRYARDNRGRFSSTGATARGGRLRTASGQKRQTQTRKISARPAGTIGKARAPKPAGPANSIRRTRVQPLVQRANNVRPYRPATFDGKFAQIDRQIDRSMKPLVDDMRAISNRAKALKPEIDKMSRRIERTNARSISDRRKKGIDGEIARAELGAMGTKPGRKAIQRRMGRAMDAAARGSKPARKAVRVYVDQLAGMGPGKMKGAKNNLRPGPRNTDGPPKRRRKRK